MRLKLRLLLHPLSKAGSSPARGRLILLLAALAFIALGCSGTDTPPDPSAPPSYPNEASSETIPPGVDTEPPTAVPPTLAPYPGDPPQPPTIAAPTVSSPDIIVLNMLNELDGWAISETDVLRTTDGGSTWYNVSPEGAAEFGFGTAHTFMSASQAWVVLADASDPFASGVLYRTEDGGLTWTAYPVPFGSGEMDFVDETHGWMMSTLGAGAGSMAVSLYTTDDGGATWTQAYTNDPNLVGAGDSLPLGGIKSNLTPLSEEVAWVGGVVYSPETFYLFKTTDGGQTWTPQTIPTAPGMQDTEVAVETGPIFPTPTDGILPIRFTGETMRTGFYTTNDSGETWEFVTFMPGAGAVDFVSPTDGIFWNGQQFFVTTDGAETWASVDPDVPFGDSFIGMDFVNTNTGWVWTYDADGQYRLYKTTDGGATWFPMES